MLVSGSGTNLQALLDATAAPGHPARIALVLSDRPGAYALERARDAGVPTAVVRGRDHPTREAYDAEVCARLRAHACRWVCLAGFMRLVTPVLLQAFPHRVLNIHPALLPAFPGLHGQAQALEHGVRIAGATVHLVDEGTDAGPIVAQGAVPVLPTDDVEALRARHPAPGAPALPDGAPLGGRGEARVRGRKVIADLAPGEHPYLFDPRP